MKLVIDTREHKIKDFFEKTEDSFNYTIQQCDIGDFIFYDDEDNIKLIIERKTVADLYSSINDGRYKEQKLRLMSNYTQVQIIYIIENDIEMTDSRYKIITGAILNTLLRDKIRIIRSRNIPETVYILKTIYKKMGINPEWFSNENSNANSNEISTEIYSSTIKTKKKANMTPQVCQIVQLSQIPGVSNTYSKLILEHYNSLSNLILSYTECNTIEEKESMLMELIIKTSTGKSRKLGKVLSARIYNYLLFN